MEKWKDVKGFEGWYEVSDLGTVRSVARYITHSCGKIQHNPSKIKKPQLHKEGKGYYTMQLFKNSKHFKRYVHRMVAESFIPNPLNKPQVNHIDGNPKNNHVNNLEWVTGLENMQHAHNTGLIDKRKPVRRLATSGKFIDFESVKEAAKSVGANYPNGVADACKQNKMYKGYYWVYLK
jgi:hypothetical protein